jgi:IS5 family transposase
MDTLTDFALREKYKRVRKLRSRLEEMRDLIDWDEFLKLFPDRETDRGRPPYDEVLMLKILVLQGWNGISDEELEFQINDRLSFRQFLGFPENIPDYSTIWRFREGLREDGRVDAIWEELDRQIKAHGIKVRKGKVQDASFIQADPGKKSGKEGRGREAKTSRSRDGTWTKKGKKSYFGFKTHMKVDRETKMIDGIAVTTASVADANIDLAERDDIVYRDKGYPHSRSRALGNATMRKKARGKGLSAEDYWRNKRIAKKRCIGEHPLGTIKRSFKGGRTRLTTTGRVFVQQAFVAMGYNIHRLRFLLRPKRQETIQPPEPPGFPPAIAAWQLLAPA